MSNTPNTSTSHQWTTIGTFNRLADARTFESMLKLEGIDARVYDERALQRLWFWVHPKAGIHVQVDKSRLGSAEACFRKASNLWMRAVRCPECESSRVQYPAVTRKNMLPALLDHVFTLIGRNPVSYYCENCHYTWDRPHQGPSEAQASRRMHLN